MKKNTIIFAVLILVFGMFVIPLYMHFSQAPKFITVTFAALSFTTGIYLLSKGLTLGERFRREALIGVLQETKDAHTIFEKEVTGGKRDELWARWYAWYLKTHFGYLFENNTTQDHIEMALVQADIAHANTTKDWKCFYTDYLINL